MKLLFSVPNSSGHYYYYLLVLVALTLGSGCSSVSRTKFNEISFVSVSGNGINKVKKWQIPAEFPKKSNTFDKKFHNILTSHRFSSRTDKSAYFSQSGGDEIPQIDYIQDLISSGTLSIYRNCRQATNESNQKMGDEPEMIFLVGTSHISQESANQVQRVIEAVQPESVVIELCRSRVGILMEEEGNPGQANPFSLSGKEGAAETIQRSLRLGGQSTFFLRGLLAGAAKGIGVPEEEKLKIGSDFRAAFSTAEKIGAETVLGDRPIEITLKRAWRGLSLKDKAVVIFSLVFGSAGALKGQEKYVKQAWEGNVEKDVLEKMEQSLCNSFPGAADALIHERDLYLAMSLKRSYAVRGKKRVVGVIGKGHVQGVLRNLERDFDQEKGLFKRLTKDKYDERTTADVITRVLIETGVGYLLWELYQRFSSSSSI